MKNTYLLTILFLLLYGAAGNLSCSKKSDSASANFSGILYTDNQGNILKAYGDVSDDWGFSNNLSAKEVALFDFADTINMATTTVLSNPQILPAYPNPAKSAISLAGLFGTGNQYTKLKIVVVDPFYNVAIRGAVLVHGPTQVLLNLSGNFAYQKNGIYRIYYSLSALNNPNYKMGYGDFQICPGYLTTPNCP